VKSLPNKDDLWEFPCDFPLKIMGVAEEQLLLDVVEVIQKHVPGNYSPKIKPSSQGNYHAITVNIIAQNKPQLDALYRELHALELVKVLL
jgi:hypothetical protein